jgi:hypothetical protein
MAFLELAARAAGARVIATDLAQRIAHRRLHVMMVVIVVVITIRAMNVLWFMIVVVIAVGAVDMAVHGNSRKSSKSQIAIVPPRQPCRQVAAAFQT